MRMLTRLSYIVVLLVLALIGSIVVPGVGFVLPRLATSPLSWLMHTTISYALTVGVLFNYLAATFTTPGTVAECCADIPPAFRPQPAGGAADASSGISSVSGGGASGRSSRADGGDRHSANGSDGERSSGGGSDGEVSNGDVREGLASGGGADGAAGQGLGAAAVGPGGYGGACGGGGTDGGANGPPPAAVESAALDTVGGGGSGGGKGGAHSGTDAPAAAPPQQSASAPPPPPRHPAQLVLQYSYSHLRYCWLCRGPQTHGSHHCYACGLCVVDQDHHCPFIANCVGRANLRNFLSFLAFTVISMTYTTGMSAWLLIRDREDAAEALGTAAATARRARAATAAAAAASGGGSRLSRSLAPLTSRADALVTFALTLVSRAPLHLTAAAYILLMSVAVFAAIGALLAQTVRHAVRMVDGVDPAAAQRVARHHVHPASDAAAALVEAAEGFPGRGGIGGWRDTVRVLRTVMCGGNGGGSDGSGGGSAWLWVWPLWGPPPGVVLAPARAAASNRRQQRQHPCKGAARSSGAVSGAQGRSKTKTQ